MPGPRLLLPVLVSLLSVLPLEAATVAVNTRENGFQEIRLHGQIVTGDVDRLLRVFSSFDIARVPLPQINLASPGGEVEEALRLGQLIRSARVRVLVEGECASACFFVFAAAVERASSESAVFLLHRPFFEPSRFAELDSQDAQDEYTRLERAVRAYLKAIRVPQHLVDSMMQYNSTSALRVEGYAITDLIGTEDAAHEEWLIAKCGGLSPEEDRDIYGLFLLDCDFMPTPEKPVSRKRCEQLKAKWGQISICREDSIHLEQQRLVEALRPKGSPK